ncbi:DUF4097 and DUF4098 domain-containing protein YvlB [Paenibacillus forsythiae]|uniref:DUF4097 and DUF4098 domain-containing protein YvlB n=1 Tax=Paenibacillus forsythiae TaxID=365616 RepID=A0ABU3H9Q2_9BACL|nr:DUF4097 family beta strand repeat-containing protein [Paenibacillus forsythiae]MDT3427552.1 DUF4097 and DUF4098 domain-containing protein YvlB [Paenibacillus forsythiae]
MKHEPRVTSPSENQKFFSTMDRGDVQLTVVEESGSPEVIPPRQKQRPVKRKFIAGLLAAMVPGAGHLYLGLLRKGISFPFLIVLDIAALLYFSSIGMQINVPLLILLALCIPAVYFFNVYDALQSADRMIHFGKIPGAADPVQAPRRRFISEPGISFGLLLLLGGAMLFLFRQRPVWLRHFIEHQAGAAAGILLITFGVILAARETLLKMLRRRHGDRIGRFTASFLLVGVGILLFRDWQLGTDNMLLLLKWWPTVPVMWGLEYLFAYLIARRPRKAVIGSGFRPDFRGLLPAILLGASVFIVSEQEHYLHLWNKVSLNLTAAAVDYGEAKGSKFQKPALTVPVELNTAKLDVDAINGDIFVHRSPIDHIEITPTVWIDQLEGARAEAVSDQSFIEVAEGATIKLTTKGKAYGESGKRQPRIDLDIAIPDNRRFNLQITTMNGGIKLQNTEAIQDISLETGNGPIILYKVFGSVKGKTHNGEVRVREVEGDVDLATNGGDMRAWDVAGALKLSTAVGNISAERSGNELDVSTRNGNVAINEVRSSLNAQSLNGIIDIRSPYVQGDWNIYSAVGDIDLRLPVEGSYSLKGSSSYGDIVSGIPGLVIDKKTISGKIGTGEFKVEVEGNSNLNVIKN